jgi:hypothetical protein
MGGQAGDSHVRISGEWERTLPKVREHIKNIRAFNHSLTFALTPDGHSSRLDVTQAWEATLAEFKPWFLVMTPEDANRPGAQGVRRESGAQDRIVIRPIAVEGWIALFAFAATAMAVPLAVWLGMVSPGLMSAALAIAWTVVVEAILVAVFVLLVQSRMTSPTAVQRPKPVKDGWDQTFQILW